MQRTGKPSGERGVAAGAEVSADQPGPDEVPPHPAGGRHHDLVLLRNPAFSTSVVTAYCRRYGRKCVDGDTEMGVKDMTTLVMTLATLNHAPVQHARLLDHVSARLKDVADTLPEHVWLDTVWSLTLLNKVTSEQLQSVLNPIFYNVILCKYKVSESVQRNYCIEKF